MVLLIPFQWFGYAKNLYISGVRCGNKVNNCILAKYLKALSSKSTTFFILSRLCLEWILQDLVNYISQELSGEFKNELN